MIEDIATTVGLSPNVLIVFAILVGVLTVLWTHGLPGVKENKKKEATFVLLAIFGLLWAGGFLAIPLKNIDCDILKSCPSDYARVVDACWSTMDGEYCQCSCVVDESCGDGVCENGETSASCFDDCGFSNLEYCGDGVCSGGETTETCSKDCSIYDPDAWKINNGGWCSKDSQCLSSHCVHGKCRSTDPYCGDHYCDSGESCNEDCSSVGCQKSGQDCDRNSDCCDGYACYDGECAPTVGDGDDDGGDNDGGDDMGDDVGDDNSDNDEGPICGNTRCEDGEDVESCRVDCYRGQENYCGDNICGTNADGDEETKANCPDDCGSSVVCGDGLCMASESHAVCPDDCSSFCEDLDGYDYDREVATCPNEIAVGCCAVQPSEKQSFKLDMMLVFIGAIILITFLVLMVIRKIIQRRNFYNY